jgi:FeS assembly SUF system protein
VSDTDEKITASETFAETWAEPQKAALDQAEIDPEIPVDVYELGLIYKVDLSDDRDVLIDMTLTAPGCPVAGEMPGWIEDAVKKVEGVRSARANLVFEPPWDPSKMSDEAKLALNMF